MQHIIYMQEASGQPHIDQYRSKLCSLYIQVYRPTSNDRLRVPTETQNISVSANYNNTHIIQNL